MKKSVSLILSLLLILTILIPVGQPLSARAEEPEEPESETILFDNIVFTENEEIPDDSYDISLFEDDLSEEIPDSPSNDGALYRENNPVANGPSDAPEVPFESPDIDMDAALDKTGEGLVPESFDEEYEPDSPILDFGESAPTASGSLLSYVKASSSSINVNVGSSVTIAVTGFSVYSNCYFTVWFNGNVVNCKWGNGSGGRVPLTVYGKSPAGSSLKIQLIRKSDKAVLAETSVSVKVESKVRLTASRSEASVSVGGQTTVTLSYSGFEGTLYLNYSLSNNNASVTFGKCNNGCLPMYIQGKNRGSTVISLGIVDQNGNVYARATVTAYIVSNASITFSKSSLNVDVDASQTNTLTINNFNSPGTISFSVSNKNCSVAWEGGWNGSSINLRITGVYGGTAVVTLSLYTERDELVARSSFTVYVKESARVTANVGSLNLTTADTSKLTFAYSGTQKTIYLNCSVDKNNILECSWNKSWNNDRSIGMSVKGLSPGTATITVRLCESGSNTVLAYVQVTVKVSGDPAVGFSEKSVSFKTGDQKIVKATAYRIAYNYYMNCKVYGDAVACEWATGNIVNNSADLRLKAVRQGTSTVTVTIYENGTDRYITSSSITATVQAQPKPTLTVSPTKLTVEENDTETVTLRWSGLENIAAQLFYEQSANKTEISGRLADNCVIVSIKGKSIGNTNITFILRNTANNETLATAELPVEVVADSAEVKAIAYTYRNYVTDIDRATFRLGFSNDTLADSLYNLHSHSEGVCYGFSTTSMLFDAGRASLSSFNKTAIGKLTGTDYSSAYGMTIKRFIELMQISQFSSLNTSESGLNTLCNLVGNGEKLKVGIHGPEGGHAILAYRLDRTNNRLYIYDSNYPYDPANPTSAIRYISLSKNSSGQYTGWEYTLGRDQNGKLLTWNNNNGWISYQRLAKVNEIWSSRGTWNRGALGSSQNYLITDSDHFTLYDVEDNVVAVYKNGVLTTENEDIIKVDISGFNPDAEEQNPYDVFILPVDYYQMENNDPTDTSFYAEMINNVYGAKVETTAKMISFAVDDSIKFCSTQLMLNAGDTYTVKLMNSNSENGDYELEGFSRQNNAMVSCGLQNNELTHNNVHASLSVDGELTNTYTVTAAASRGGTVTPAGETIAMSDDELTYTFTPDAGYEIADVFINGESCGAISDYTFFGVSEDSEINVVFAKKDTPEFKTGDVDGNGSVNAADARAALRMAVELDVYPEDSREFFAADVDRSGSVTAADARLILRAAVGLEELK